MQAADNKKRQNTRQVLTLVCAITLYACDKPVKQEKSLDLAAEINTNQVAPEQWRTGIFTSPHGIAFDSQGRLYVSEWNV